MSRTRHPGGVAYGKAKPWREAPAWFRFLTVPKRWWKARAVGSSRAAERRIEQAALVDPEAPVVERDVPDSRTERIGYW